MPTKRYEISDYQWNQIMHLFPVAKTGQPPKDNRMVFHAILWVARSGSAWRDLPERYGSWKTVYSRFCKWRDNGTLQRIFEALSADADYENLSIDSTLVRVHQHSAGAKKGRQGMKLTDQEKPRREHDQNPYHSGRTWQPCLFSAFGRQCQ